MIKLTSWRQEMLGNIEIGDVSLFYKEGRIGSIVIGNGEVIYNEFTEEIDPREAEAHDFLGGKTYKQSYQ